ncbi:MAG: alpha/beta hydrolase [Parcubacteria group bacterium]|jgi:pimeloyl-ACP methyl ester carboxylesterase
MIADKDSSFPEKFVDAGKGKIFYRFNQRHVGCPVIVFLHGLSANHTTWLTMMKTFEAIGYNSLSPDMRGHGLSDKTRKRKLYNMKVFADDLRDIIQKEKIGEHIIVGYSYGGEIALEYAGRRPRNLKALVVISTNCVSPLKYKKINFLTPVIYAVLNFLSVILIWQSRKKYHYYRQGKSRGYWHSVWIGLNTMPLSVNFWMLSQMGLINFKKALARIKVPTLIIRGKKDPFVSKAEAEDMAAMIPDAELITFDNPSHFIGSRSQDELTEEILKFLRRRKMDNTSKI